MPIVGPFGNECDRSLNIERSLDIGSPVSTVGGLLLLRTAAAVAQPPLGTAYRPICEESSLSSFIFILLYFTLVVVVGNMVNKCAYDKEYRPSIITVIDVIDCQPCAERYEHKVVILHEDVIFYLMLIVTSHSIGSDRHVICG